MVQYDFSGKTILITGGTRGIGAAITRAFAKSNATVIAVYKDNEQAAHDLLEELKGYAVHKTAADLSNVESIRQLSADVLDEWGAVDILVNNAAINLDNQISDPSYRHWAERWDRTLAVNLLAPAHLSYFFGSQMITKGDGRIINISSRGAFRGEPDNISYGASKAGLNSMSQSMAHAFAKFNIKVFAIAPGFVETDMALDRLRGENGDKIRNQSPFRRVAKPEEIASAVLYFASGEADWSSGAILDINGASYLRT